MVTTFWLTCGMVAYRRVRIAGASYFFAVTLRDRGSDMLVARADDLRMADREVRQQRPFSIAAAVILPDHLHMIWTLPPDDCDYSGRWRAIKSRFSQALVLGGIHLQRNGGGEYDLWQRRFWEHTLRNEDDFSRHVNYIRYNPVKHGYVSIPAAWPLSSIHRDIRAGIIPLDWAGDITGDCGEPR